MVHYNVTMRHSEHTFEKLAHMQYDLFCKGNLIVRTILGMGAGSSDAVTSVSRALSATLERKVISSSSTGNNL